MAIITRDFELDLDLDIWDVLENFSKKELDNLFKRLLNREMADKNKNLETIFLEFLENASDQKVDTITKDLVFQMDDRLANALRRWMDFYGKGKI